MSYWLLHAAALGSWMNVLIGRDGWFNYPLGVLWSLSVEEVFYLGFPLACVVLRTKGRLAAFSCLFIVIGPVWRLANQDDEAGALYAYLACFDGIAIGCCAALLAERLAVRGRAVAALQAAVVAGMAFLYLEQSIADTNVFGVTLIAVGTAVLLFGAQANAAGETLARSHILAGLRWLGRHSYELYLFHLVVLGALRSAAPPAGVSGDARLLVLAAYFVLSATLAAFVAGFYSDPLNRFLRQRSGVA